MLFLYILRINRNIVECKVWCNCYTVTYDAVLIETLWNVKCNSRIRSRRYLKCINRNIVECKAFKHNGYEVSSDVLIETLWNVKTR